MSAPLPPLNGVDANGDITASGSGSDDGSSGHHAAGAAAVHRRRPRRYARQQYARVRRVLRPARSDSDYADWCAVLAPLLIASGQLVRRLFKGRVTCRGPPDICKAMAAWQSCTRRRPALMHKLPRERMPG